ncbi:MAG TPA: DUF2905 domain-containing protein [Nitrospiraceae bacterium]|nr:DUF2905 domain-containing protein [Nitrospiraceae bacterium]
MSELGGIGKLLIVLGVALVILGALATLLGKLSGAGFGWLGKLPGDFLFKRDNATFYFPLATSLLISVALSVLLYLVSFFLKR